MEKPNIARHADVEITDLSVSLLLILACAGDNGRTMLGVQSMMDGRAIEVAASLVQRGWIRRAGSSAKAVFYITGTGQEEARKFVDQLKGQAGTSETLEVLRDVTSVLRTVLLHQGPAMTPEDRRTRTALCQRAEHFLDGTITHAI